MCHHSCSLRDMAINNALLENLDNYYIDGLIVSCHTALGRPALGVNLH